MNGLVTQSQAALDWCIEARKKLKLGRLSKSDPTQIGTQAEALKKKLDALPGQLPRTPENVALQARLEREFYEIGGRAKDFGEKQAKSQMKLEAQRLAELSALIDVQLAGGDAKKAEKAGSALAKTRIDLQKRQDKFKDEQQALRQRAEGQLTQLKAIKFADPTALKARIEQAKLLVADEAKANHAGALDLLSGCTSLFEEAKTAAEKLRKQELDNVGQQAHYETKVRKIEEVLEELKGKPGTDSFVVKLQDALKRGAAALARPAGSPLETDLYRDGYDAIVEQVPSTSDLRSAALKASAKTIRIDHKDTELVQARDDARAALRALTEPERLVDSQTAADRGLALSNALARCVAPNDRASGLKELQGFTTGTNKAREELHAAFTACGTHLERARTAYENLLHAATQDELQALQKPFSTLQLARSLAGALDFKGANLLLGELMVELGTLEAASDHTPQKLEARWKDPATSRQLEETRLALARLIKSRGDAKLDTTYAQQMLRELDAAAKNADGNWSRALSLLEAIGKAVDREAKSDVERTAFADGTLRTSLVAGVATARDAAQKAFEELRVRLGKERDSIGTVEGLRAKLTEAGRAWDERAASATNETMLDAVAATRAFEALTKEFQDAVASPATVERTLADGRRSVLLKDWEQRTAEVQSLLDTLRLRNTEAAQPLAERLGHIRKNALGAIDFSAADGVLAQLAQLKDELTRLGLAQDTALADARQAAALKHQEADQAVKALRAQANKSLKTYHRNQFEPFFKTLDQELADLKALVTSDSLTTAQTAPKELQLLIGRIARLNQEVLSQPKDEDATREVADTLLRQVDGPDDGDDDTGLGIAALFNENAKPNFRLVMDAVALIRSALESKELAECLPVQQFQMKEAFKEMQKDVGTLEPSAAFAMLKRFHGEVAGAIAKARDAKIKRDNFAVSLREVQVQYVKLGGLEITSLRGRLPEALRKTPPTTYLAALDHRLRAAQTMSTQTQKEDRALSMLMKIRAEIMAVLENGDARVEREKQAQADQFQTERESVRWEALVKDFEKLDLRRAREALKQPGSDASQGDDLDRMLARARKVFEDTGNFVGALELLENARKYAARVQAHPQGLKAAARDELPKVRDHWKAAVKSFNDSVVRLVDNIASTIAAADRPTESDKAQALDDAVRKSTALLAGLKTLFNANAMDAPIAAMTKPKASVADQRAGREAAMRQINQYKAVLRTDPVLLKLVQREQPFGSVDFYGLNAALRDLDLNVQRAV